MKLFRRIEPKSTHRHAKALEHLANAHKALMKEKAEDAQQHIGRAFQAVSASLPKQAPAKKPTAAPPMIEPGNDIGATPNGAPVAPPNFAKMRAMSARMK
jgi:hypothetical protein